MYQHEPVLLTESITGLSIQPDGFYVDATFGRGGHSQAILKELGVSGRLLALDQDPAAAPAAYALCTRDARFLFFRESFVALYRIVVDLGWMHRIRGVLLDLGVSSPQLEEGERGFSFLKDGPLDMRMNPDIGMSAAEWLNHATAKDIEKILRDYGEERFARRIANAIVHFRASQYIDRTATLSAIIQKAHPAWAHHVHPATRSFQAIRIFINNELDVLREVLSQISEILAPGGRLCVMSFHSLEDRIVKQWMRKRAYPEEDNRWLANFLPKPDNPFFWHRCGTLIRPSVDELTRNPRARSAKLRIAEKLR